MHSNKSHLLKYNIQQRFNNYKQENYRKKVQKIQFLEGLVWPRGWWWENLVYIISKSQIGRSPTCASRQKIRIIATMHFLTVGLFVATLFQASLGASNKLYVKFTPHDKDPNHSQGYYELPRSLNNLSTNDGSWNVVEDLLSKEGIAVVCRNNDYRVCLVVDKKNSIAGLQLSVAVADFKKTNAPVTPHLTKKTVLGTEVYSAYILFVENDVLKGTGRDMTENTETAPNGIFLKTDNGLRTIPKKEENIAGSKFVKQQCFPGMGRHYFYDWTKQTDCAHLDPYFALYNEQTHDLVGVGYFGFGNATVQENGRPWFEYMRGASKLIAPDAPDCAGEFVGRYGGHSLHMYLTNEPWNLKC